MSSRAWDVFLPTTNEHGTQTELIDTVWFDTDCDADYVKRSLVEHDGYDPGIEISGTGLVICRSCGATVSESLAVCDECGADLTLPDAVEPHRHK